MPRPVVSIGECLIDLIAPEEVDLSAAAELHVREGGAPANVAVALARLGVDARLHAVVGGDPFGERLRTRLEWESVDVSAMRIAPDVPTTVAFAWSDASGDGHFRIHRHADTLLCPDDVSESALQDARAIVVGSVAMTAEPSGSAVMAALRHAANLGIPSVIDLNVRPGPGVRLDALRDLVSGLLGSVTMVKLSVDDARILWGSTSIEEAVAMLDGFGCPVGVVTDGGRGAALRTSDGAIHQDVFPVQAIEPTGAGDAFTAAFISRMLSTSWRGASADDLRFAMAAGALATTRRGAMDALPTMDEVARFLRELP